MLEHVPNWLGQFMSRLRAGGDALVIADRDLAIGGERLALASPAFSDGGRLPARFTADGEGISPPLEWNDVPAGTASFALIVEDADAPTPSPLVHAIVWAIPPDRRSLAEGAIRNEDKGDAAEAAVGRNSYFGKGWLPPDPPTGHGEHRYVFQLFALRDTPELAATPGRAELVRALAGRVIAAGTLAGTYERSTGPA